MSKLLLVLSAFYQCDIAITEHSITQAEMRECIAIADKLSATFLTRDERLQRAAMEKDGRLEMMTLGLRRFKDWEAENAALVAKLRFQARSKLNGEEPV